jgi:hypothetical protein
MEVIFVIKSADLPLVGGEDGFTRGREQLDLEYIEISDSLIDMSDNILVEQVRGMRFSKRVRDEVGGQSLGFEFCFADNEFGKSWIEIEVSKEGQDDDGDEGGCYQTLDKRKMSHGHACGVAVAGKSMVGLYRLLVVSAEIVGKTDDIIFSQIRAVLYLDKFENNIAGIFQPMFFPGRNIG